MNYQVDPQFVTRTNTLVREILSDESRFVSRNDQTFQILHNKIFSKVDQTPFKDLQDTEKTFFNKYFYIGGAVGSPRLDIPFADSAEDQAFFFDQFRNQVKNLTYNYDRMDFLQPRFLDEQAQTPTFDDNQTLLLTRGIVYPCLSALEQRQIAKIEKKKASPGSDESVESPANPYANLGNKVLVKGISGEFDQILTYDQLEQIAKQEDLLHQQGLAQDEITKRLREYLTNTFPGLNIVLDENGKLQTFLGAAGFSASGNPTGPTDQPPVSSISFADLIKEMKIRQGRTVQYDAIIAGKGNLAFTTDDFQIKNANGITTTVNGLTLTIDQAGFGNNAVFFLRDKQGTSARFSIDTAALRAGEKPPLNIAIYQKPAEDNPAGPKLKIGPAEMDKLQKALLVLYNQAQKPGEYETAGEKPKLIKPISTPEGGALPGTKPLPAGEEGGYELGIPFSPDLELQIPAPISLGFTAKTKPGQAIIPGGTGAVTTTTTKKVMLKIPSKPLPPPAKTAEPGEVSGGKATEGTVEYKQKITGKEEIPSANPPTPKKKIPAVVKGLFFSGLAAAAALAGAMASVPPGK